MGWVSIHKEICSHWIWQDPVKFKWWITMLLEVNYQEGTMYLGNKNYVIKRGQSSKSIRSWALSFGCGTKAVINFFSVLEKEKMISKEIIGKGKHSTTLINITNYNDYQDTKETLKQRKGNARNYAKGGTIEYYNKLLSEIEISDIPLNLVEYYNIAKEYQKLFISNLSEKNSSTKNQEQATFKSYVDPIRLMIEKDDVKIQDLRDIYSYLASPEGEFWKSNILSTSKLRGQYQKLIMSARKPKYKSNNE